MLQDIVIRAIASASIRSCGWWLMGAFWSTLFQVAVEPMQWVMAKGNTIGKTVAHQMEAEVARIDMEELEAQRLNPDELKEPSSLNNLNRLMN
jgi:hypothetical protein